MPNSVKVLVLLLLFACLFTRSVLAGSASLKLYPGEGKYALNEELKVLILLDTEDQETIGTDFNATFNAQRLEIVDIVPGTLYSTYVGKTIDNENGKIAISGIVGPGETYKGDSVFATIIGKAKKEGKADITISFEDQNRNDSNIAAVSGDILGAVENAEFHIVGEGFGKNIWEKIVKFLGSFKFPLPVKEKVD